MKLRQLLVFLLAGSLLVGACGGQTVVETRAPLKVAWVLWGGWYPIVIAQEQGLFQKHGVEVEPVFYEIYSDIPADFATGKVDGGLFALFDILPLESYQQAAGGIVSDRVVMVTDDSRGADAVVAKAGIASVAGLKGQRLGVKIGSYAEVMIQRVLEDNGLTTGDVQLVDVPPERALEALTSGKVDAIHAYEPYVSQTLAEGYHILFSSAQTPGIIPNVLAFHGEVLRDRPEDVRAFVAAWFEAQAYWLANPEAGNQIIATATGQKPEDISLAGIEVRTLEANRSAFQPRADPDSLYFSTQYNLDFLVKSGMVSAAPDVNNLLDASFLP